MDKTAIRNFAIEARKILMKSAITEAGFYGITKDGCKDPVQKGNDFEVYETVAGTENRIFGDDIKRRANLVQAIKTLGFEQVIEETAYTWFNRIIAIRFMEVNNYLPTRVRVLSSETGSGTPDIITQADTVELNLTLDELEKIQTAKRENRYDDAFRMLFIKQCNELNAILPGLFEKTDDYMELLLKITYTGDGVIRMLVDSIPEDNFNVETEGQVEIIGWMYQYYNTELKDDTFAKLKKNVKITKERIPAATQLFTPDWIVRYMVENSLGRVWIEHLRAVNPSVDEKAKAEEFGWKYYLPEAEQDDDVQTQLVEIRKSYKDLTPQDITCIDPCMGSGHILVYMFDVLMDIYRSEGFSEREAVFDVLEKNIRGLDIDRRAYQLSYFALMMKARGYNRIFFRGHEDIDGNRVQAVPRVYAIEESNSIDRNQLKYFGAGLDELSKNNALNQMNGLLDSLRDAREYGSIISIDNYEWELLRKFLLKLDDDGQGSLFGYMAYQSKETLDKLVNIGEILARKYDVVITNPPYMGGGSANGILSDYLKKNYNNSKMDMFAVFVERCMNFSNHRAYLAMITQQALMFLSSFSSLREIMLENWSFESMLHLGFGTFGADFGTVAYVMKKVSCEYKGVFFDLSEVKSSEEKKGLFEHSMLKSDLYQTDKKMFLGLPNCIFAYWLSEDFVRVYAEKKSLGDVAPIKAGMKTGDNKRFLRLWSEVDISKTKFDCVTYEDIISSKKKWFPYNKGGESRMWYGNHDYVINMENGAEEIISQGREGDYRLRDKNNYFKQSLSWSFLTAGRFSARYYPTGFLCDVAGSSIYPEEKDIYYLLGILASKVANECLKIQNPTLNFQVENLSNIPYINTLSVDENNEVEKLVKECIEASKCDWDDFEKSWNFTTHPIIKYSDKCDLVKDAYEKWEQIASLRFNEQKKREERINELIIQSYGLDGDLSPYEEESDVNIRKANLNRDIKSLLSYAVGCMVGRYSLDEEGLVYAGGEFDRTKYKTFAVDEDAIIPITDEAYFRDDIVGRFEDFLCVIYGEDTLEENLEFIADALGSRGSSSREKIREYFLCDFFKDHCTMYSVTGSGKRPIYWLFDSGKQNGFKCLIYLHRYNPDIVGRIRSDYLTKTQNMIENALKNAEYAINTSSSAVDKAQATKKRDKYIKQLAEIRAYYPALSHIALQRIDLDLDDGVKANYEKFQNIEVSIEGEKKQKVNLLAKI